MKTEKIRRHFSDLTEEEVMGMSYAMENAAVKFAQKVNMSGLSHSGVHNIYTMVQEGLYKEWNKSKRVMKKFRKDCEEDK